MSRERVVVIVRVELKEDADLSEAIEAVSSLSLGFRLGQRWQEHASQNGDDGDDNEELDQGESFAPAQAEWINAFHTAKSKPVPIYCLNAHASPASGMASAMGSVSIQT